jgi:cystinosin
MSKEFDEPARSAGASALAKWARSEFGLCVLGGLFVLALGVALGFGVPSGSSQLSSVLGWTYFAAWSVSFWPQILVNRARRSVVGLSFDYVALNLVGFSCYSAYNCAYFFNSAVRAEYAQRYGAPPAVQLNDVFFGLHAVFATCVTIAQMAVYERGGQSVSLPARGLLAALVLAIVAAVALSAAGTITTLTMLLALSYLKLVVSLTKYTPQAVMNWRRRSTEGWSIHNVLLDFTGGLLSVLQLVIDCSAAGDWSGAIGDPVKFGLGFASMVYDVVFMVQHYALYPSKEHGNEYEAIVGQ